MNQVKAKWALRAMAIVIVATFLTFLTLKLCGVLPWSWWWVFAPIWASILAAIFLAGLFAFIVIAFASQTKPEKK